MDVNQRGGDLGYLTSLVPRLISTKPNQAESDEPDFLLSQLSQRGRAAWSLCYLALSKGKGLLEVSKGEGLPVALSKGEGLAEVYVSISDPRVTVPPTLDGLVIGKEGLLAFLASLACLL